MHTFIQFSIFILTTNFVMASKNYYPFEWEDVENDSDAKTNFKLARSTPGGHLLRRGLANIAESIYNMEVRPDDIWLLAHPKTGSTMMRELVWDVAFGARMAKPTKYHESVSLVEMSGVLSEQITMMLKSGNIPEQYRKLTENVDERSKKYHMDSVGFLEERKSPRLLKSHVPMELLPPDLLTKAKVVYLARNPKAVCCSLFHHMNNNMHSKVDKELEGMVKNFNGTFDDFVQLFIEGKLGWGDYFKHLKGAWAQRNNPNFFFVWYEDAIDNMTMVIKNLAAFLDREISEEDISLLEENMKKENFRKRYLETKIGQTVQFQQDFHENFVRKDNRDDPTMSPQINSKFDAWIEENFRDGDLAEAKIYIMGQPK